MSYTRKDNIKKPQTFYKFYKQNIFINIIYAHCRWASSFTFTAELSRRTAISTLTL